MWLLFEGGRNTVTIGYDSFMQALGSANMSSCTQVHTSDIFYKYNYPLTPKLYSLLLAYACLQHTIFSFLSEP